METVDQFIEQLLVDKGITDLEPDIKEEVMADMKKRLMGQINEVAVLKLPAEKAEELAKKVDNPEFTEEKMMEFMKGAGVDLTQIALEAMLEFRNFYLKPGE